MAVEEARLEEAIVNPESEVAQARGAGVEERTPKPSEAYERFTHWRLGCPDPWAVGLRL
jgi:hypothetical protein